MPIKIVSKKDQTPAPTTAVEIEPVVAKTSVSTHHGKTELTYKEEEEHLGDAVKTEPMANIGVSASRTINLGNYNAAKISVTLHYPCKITEIDKTYELVKDWVDEKMSAIMSESTSGA